MEDIKENPAETNEEGVEGEQDVGAGGEGEAEEEEKVEPEQGTQDGAGDLAVMEEGTKAQEENQEVIGPSISIIIPEEHVEDHQMLSIIALLMCFPVGIAAVSLSFMSKKQSIRKKRKGATTAANTARMVALIGIVVGAIIILAFMIAALVYLLTLD